MAEVARYKVSLRLNRPDDHQEESTTAIVTRNGEIVVELTAETEALAIAVLPSIIIHASKAAKRERSK